MPVGRRFLTFRAFTLHSAAGCLWRGRVFTLVVFHLRGHGMWGLRVVARQRRLGRQMDGLSRIGHCRHKVLSDFRSSSQRPHPAQDVGCEWQVLFVPVCLKASLFGRRAPSQGVT